MKEQPTNTDYKLTIDVTLRTSAGLQLSKKSTYLFHALVKQIARLANARIINMVFWLDECQRMESKQ